MPPRLPEREEGQCTFTLVPAPQSFGQLGAAGPGSAPRVVSRQTSKQVKAAYAERTRVEPEPWLPRDQWLAKKAAERAAEKKLDEEWARERSREKNRDKRQKDKAKEAEVLAAKRKRGEPTGKRPPPSQNLISGFLITNAHLKRGRDGDVEDERPSKRPNVERDGSARMHETFMEARQGGQVSTSRTGDKAPEVAGTSFSNAVVIDDDEDDYGDFGHLVDFPLTQAVLQSSSKPSLLPVQGPATPVAGRRPSPSHTAPVVSKGVLETDDSLFDLDDFPRDSQVAKTLSPPAAFTRRVVEDPFFDPDELPSDSEVLRELGSDPVTPITKTQTFDWNDLPSDSEVAGEL